MTLTWLTPINNYFVISETPSPSVAQLSDIYLFNLDYVSEIEVLEEKSGLPEPLPFINVSKVCEQFCFPVC